MKSALNARLFSVAELVRQGAVLADIGTDHAYLPIFLLERERISHAYLSDINRGPLASARENAEAHGLIDKVTLVLSDGAASLADSGATDYAICGMGGELIASIIDSAPHLCSPDINLILQPMTRQAHLRRYLYSHGFRIIREAYSTEGDKHYAVMQVRYVGERVEIDDCEAEIGVGESEFLNTPSRISYLRVRYAAARRARVGRFGDSNVPESAMRLEEAIAEKIEQLKA